MATECVWVAAGYPVLLVAIVGLWKAYQKSQRELLAEKESKARVLESLLDLVTAKRR